MDGPRRSARRRRAGLAVAAVCAVLAGLVVLGLNTNRVMAGTTYDDVVAVPHDMACLGGSAPSYHTIDAGGITWYEARFLPPSFGAPYGEFQELNGGSAHGQLRVLTDIGGNSFSRPALKSGDDFAEFDVGAARYLFTAGGLGAGC